jgi:hypothetical protein
MVTAFNNLITNNRYMRILFGNAAVTISNNNNDDDQCI